MDTNYLWPLSLRMPKRPPKIVYLDMNHWITLAKVMFGRCDGVKDKKLLQFCLDSVDRQVAVYPISVSIFTEILKIRDHQKRQNLRKVIERLSQFMVVTNRAVVAAHEIECFLDQAVGPNPAPINRMDYLDWGVFRAIGKDGSIKVMSASGEDITAGFRQSYTEGPEAFDRIVFEASLELNRQILDGPAPEDEASLRKQGYNPEAILNDYKNEAKNEEELARRLDDEQRWRRGRLRDLVSAREVAFQINSILKRGCHERGIDSLGSLFASINEPRNAFDSMPSFDASVTLKTAIHKNGKHRWKNNDIHDIHALAVTLPYCDIVVTDREMVSHVVHSKLARRLNALVLSDLYRLPDFLERK